ncbi:scarecrow-like protein 9 [Phtheirospermum japonicum]|uniref:Scarecrow-like protein 9 n=1 Tax=Phtheirospermum japonicum TaxID=374723 RepID=A0A830BXM2_9LAMI|nr:scarecrow-like protein 9 [Phtheirospermum japonicum]
MDQRFQMDPLNSPNVFQLENPPMAEFSNWELGNEPGLEITYPDQMLANGHSFQEQSMGGAHLLQNQPISNGAVSNSFAGVENDNYHDDCDFSREIFRYIGEMLMEEELEEQTHMLQESLDFQAKERSFYELLGQKYPQPLQQGSGLNDQENNNYSYVNHHNSRNSSSDGNGYLADVVGPSRHNVSTVRTNYIVSNSSINSSNVLNSGMNRFCDPLLEWNFRKGVADASKFLPSGSKLLGNNDVLVQSTKEGEINVESNNEVNVENLNIEARGKKNHHTEDNDCEEERSKKLPAIYPESNVPVEEFDDVLLYTVDEREKIFESYITDLQNTRRQSRRKSGLGKKQSRKKEFFDLRSLLIDCAKSVAADNQLAAKDFLKQIRKHSSPFGDGDQRLAHYFADGLEARLSGTGSHIHKALVCRRIFASDYLKSYYTYLASSPFCNLTNFVANEFIKIKSVKATRVHIIDFGVLYGFQWPTFIQSLVEREGGPPKLRITGIEFPQPGFRPAERIEESGRRLARYAKKFNVPFEFNAIAQNWETIKIEDLKIEKGEFVAVNCLYRAENLPDEADSEECSRNMVLNLIRKINPDSFIHGVVNVSYSLPFFVTRFREALHHFSALFDMLEANVPRENPERMLLERDVFGKEALNVIACEGMERVERAETYKQWRLRHLRAGFMHIPFDRGLMDSAIHKVRKYYNRDFSINEDKQWLLMGWKGRVIYAISCLQPV